MFVKNYCRKAVTDVVPGGRYTASASLSIATDIISRDCCRFLRG